ncbi:MAG: phosphopantothenoylcysteine decarboxylase [Candidatus Cloacimonadales bacterium]
MDCTFVPNDHFLICRTAVADYTSPKYSEHKIKKSDDLDLALVRTTDILAYLGQHRNEKQFLVGFAAETENIVKNARTKLLQKQVDLIVANDLKFAGQASNEISIVAAETETKFAGDKFEISHKILDTIMRNKREANE